MAQPRPDSASSSRSHTPLPPGMLEFPPPLVSTDAIRRDLIENAVAEVFGVHARELQGLSRGRAPVAQARQVAMYLTHVVFRLSLSDTGTLFGRDRTTVAHACSVIEDMRDDAVFDRVMELLESVVWALVTPRPGAACN